MKSGVWWVLLLAPCLVLAREEVSCKSAADCKGPHEDCLGGVCHCEKGALSWDGGDCLTKRHYGETCQDPNECLMAGDPHMDCLDLNTSGVKLCMCTNTMRYDFASKKCEAFEVKIMNPETKAEINIASDPSHDEINKLPDVNSFREYLESRYIDPNKTKNVPKKPNFSDANVYFGPMIVALMALIVITICCCFWRIDPRAPHDIDIERERAKAVERALAELQLDGQSNFGFQPDDWNCDSVSRYTASTEIADDKDNNKSSNNSPTNNNDNGAKAKTKTEKPKKKKEGIVTEDNTKHEDKAQTSQLIEKCKTVAEQVSVKDSTVQPPHQEEGNKVESKSRAIENWMKGHMAQIDEGPEESDMSGDFNNPFREDPFGKKSAAEMLERRIELVETDDCTSIDTSIQDGTRTFDEIVINPSALDKINADASINSTVTLQATPDKDTVA